MQNSILNDILSREWSIVFLDCDHWNLDGVKNGDQLTVFGHQILQRAVETLTRKGARFGRHYRLTNICLYPGSRKLSALSLNFFFFYTWLSIRLGKIVSIYFLKKAILSRFYSEKCVLPSGRAKLSLLNVIAQDHYVNGSVWVNRTFNIHFHVNSILAYRVYSLFFPYVSKSSER